MSERIEQDVWRVGSEPDLLLLLVHPRFACTRLPSHPPQSWRAAAGGPAARPCAEVLLLLPSFLACVPHSPTTPADSACPVPLRHGAAARSTEGAAARPGAAALLSSSHAANEPQFPPSPSQGCSLFPPTPTVLTHPPRPSAGMEQLLNAQKELLAVVQQCCSGPPALRPTFGAVGRRLKTIQKAAALAGLANVTPRRCVALRSVFQVAGLRRLKPREIQRRSTCLADRRHAAQVRLTRVTHNTLCARR